jgi:hypothetical protein
MERITYTLNVHQVDKYRYEVTIPEIGATVEGGTFDGAIYHAQQAIEKHHSIRFLVLIFKDRRFDGQNWYIDPEARLQTDLEQQTVFELEQLGIAPHISGSERHLIFELQQPLTPEQLAWLREHEGDLFDEFRVNNELMIPLDKS